MIVESGQLLPEIAIRLLAKDMTVQGYQCAATFVDDCCIGVAGIWCGRYLDVDNMIEQYRGAGIGHQHALYFRAATEKKISGHRNAVEIPLGSLRRNSSPW